MANRTNDLAKERNRAAAEPMMMAWTLIAPSLIGFGLDENPGAIRSSRSDHRAHVGLRRRLVTMGLHCW